MMPSSTLSIISTDLSHAETILQIADSLDHLELIFRSIFEGIQKRIDENFQQLDCVDQRIKVAGDKVDDLKQKKQKSSTCLYASPKYPAKEYQDYESCLTSPPNRLIRKVPPSNQKSKATAINVERGLDQRQIKEKLQFYHVKSRPKNTSSIFEPPAPKSASPFLWSSSSYLLFNTAESPFGNLSYIDPFDVRAKKNKHVSSDKPDSSEKQALAALQEAPSSLSNILGLDDPFNANLYIPELGDLPDFELPDVLPDLPGIAQNLAFATDFVDLPDIPFFDVSKPGHLQVSTEVVALTQQLPPLLPEVKPVPEIHSIPPLPPIEAPPTLPTLQLPDPEATVQSNHSMATNHAPQKSFDLPDSGPAIQLPPAVVGDDSRASLMEAIRKAGGSSKAGLKSVREQKAEEKKNKAAVVKAGKTGKGGGDLMSDLANKLAMRRKGISGAQRTEAATPGAGARVNSGSGSRFDTLSSMIPAAPKTSEKVISDASDDDWND